LFPGWHNFPKNFIEAPKIFIAFFLEASVPLKNRDNAAQLIQLTRGEVDGAKN